MKYELRIEDHPTYVHALATGARTPENALRFLREAYEACVRAERKSVLLEMRLTGDSLDVGGVFGVISDRARDGMKLSKIAYVDGEPLQAAKAVFAETVARNRGVNVKLFDDVAAAQRWLEEGSKK